MARRKYPLTDVTYEIIAEWQENGYNCTKLKVYPSGGTVTNRVPIRSREEDLKALEPFARACCEFLHPEIKGTGCPCKLIVD